MGITLLSFLIGKTQFATIKSVLTAANEKWEASYSLNSMLLVVDKPAFILFHIFRVRRYLLYCVILFPPSGLQEAQGLHSHTGTNAQHLRRLLENGVGTELGCHSDDNQTGGKNQGKKW